MDVVIWPHPATSEAGKCSLSHEATHLAKNWDAAAKEEKGGSSEAVSGVCRNWLFSRSGSLVGGTVNWASFLLRSLPWTGSPVLLKWALGKWETQAATRRELRVRQKLRVLWVYLIFGEESVSSLHPIPSRGHSVSGSHPGWARWKEWWIHLKVFDVFAFLKIYLILKKEEMGWARSLCKDQSHLILCVSRRRGKKTSLGREGWHPEEPWEWPRSCPTLSFMDQALLQSTRNQGLGHRQVVPLGFQVWKRA